MSSAALRLLLIEDSFAIAREVEALLRGIEGPMLDFHHAETLGQGLELLGPRLPRFDCVLVNLRLPDAEGLDCVRRLRAVDPQGALIVLAPPETRAVAVEALREGAQELLVHPWARTAALAQDMHRLVRSAMERKGRFRAPPEMAAGEPSGPARPPAPDQETAFALRFQPWAETQSGSIYGVEVMLGSRAAQASPRELLRAAQLRGELSELGHWLLCRVAPLWKQWRAAGIAPLRLAVNVAPSELQAPGFARARLRMHEELGLSPGELQIELAEDALVDADIKVHAELQTLRAAGVRVVADNVGRGPVALLALARLPLDAVKLDISLIEAMRNGDRAARATVRALVALCNELDILCCGVGVEVQTDYRACGELGVHHMQGYWVARPQSAEAVASWLARCAPSVSTQRYPASCRPRACDGAGGRRG